MTRVPPELSGEDSANPLAPDHPEPAQIETVVTLLDDLAKDREEVGFGEVVETLGARGYGPLLLVLSVLLILPIGWIPGVGGAVGTIMALIGLQVLRGKRGLWLPGFVRDRRLPARRLHATCDWLRPKVHWLRQRLRPRLAVVAESRMSLRIIALVLIVAGLSMTVLGVIPILPGLLGLPILCFALGVTTRDGAVVLAGYLLLVPATAIAALWTATGS